MNEAISEAPLSETPKAFKRIHLMIKLSSGDKRPVFHLTFDTAAPFIHFVSDSDLCILAAVLV